MNTENRLNTLEENVQDIVKLLKLLVVVMNVNDEQKTIMLNGLPRNLGTTKPAPANEPMPIVTNRDVWLLEGFDAVVDELRGLQ